MKRIGPNTEPRGTPVASRVGDDLQLEHTEKVLFDRYEENQERTLPRYCRLASRSGQNIKSDRQSINRIKYGGWSINHVCVERKPIHIGLDTVRSCLMLVNIDCCWLLSQCNATYRC